MTAEQRAPEFDPVLLAVLQNRFEGVVREMTNTLLRTGRSAILNTARDFSCSLVTADHQMLSSAEGLPVHVMGSQLLSRSMYRHHPDFVEGDAFIHNDPYDGNTHHADHTILVPVFFEGEHVMTAMAKAHQADTGNSQPTTYAAYARDIYEEGAVNFPCVQVQRDFADIDDIIRMAKRRIRVPEQWYGDYLAGVGAARVGERRVKEVFGKYGRETVRDFITHWFDYSERVMADQIRRMPKARLIATGRHDTIPAVGHDIPLTATIDIDPEEARITVDLRDNMDCLPCGYNMSEATTLATAMTGIFNQVDEDIPHNEGTFRRIAVLLRENCITGKPAHPLSASVATTNIADRVINMIQSAFAELGPEYGLAEGAVGQGTGIAVASGTDARRGDALYINQLFLASSGGPGSRSADGWGFFGIPVDGGIQYRDSIEIDERKYPILVHETRVVQDSEGAGRFRGGMGGRIVYGPTERPMNVMYTRDGAENLPRGVRGGMSPTPHRVYLIDRDGGLTEQPGAANIRLIPGQLIGNDTNGGGGYGDPAERDPELVRLDVERGFVSPGRAADVYRVVVTVDDRGIAHVDQEATRARRADVR
ncbi:MAG: hydantoinase B/oxoprolinase family protein [Microbacterium sp.]